MQKSPVLSYSSRSMRRRQITHTVGLTFIRSIPACPPPRSMSMSMCRSCRPTDSSHVIATSAWSPMIPRSVWVSPSLTFFPDALRARADGTVLVWLRSLKRHRVSGTGFLSALTWARRARRQHLPLPLPPSRGAPRASPAAGRSRARGAHRERHVDPFAACKS